jgi:hypothetical protein
MNKFFLLVAALMSPQVQPPFRVVGLALDQAQIIKRTCPAQVHFSGRIRTSGPGTVVYSWVRSDQSVIRRTLSFRTAGAEQVNLDWTVGKPFNGWVEFQINSPANIISNRAPFVVTCN